MSWKVLTIVLPESGNETLIHLASIPHSWTVDHRHNACEPIVCHAASHEYGLSGKEDGSQQHQHFIE